MAARSFVWLSIAGGTWSLASNWNDLTDGADPSTSAPGAQDSVTIAGPTGAALQTITGPGQAAAALFTGNTLFSGSFAIGALTLGQSSGGGLLQLAAGAALSAGTATIVSGSLLAAGAAATLSVTGSFTLGSGQNAAATLNATGGGRATVASLFLASAADGIYVDPTSILEVGTAAAGLAGQLTIDANATLAGQGNANAYGQVANSGTITAQSGTLTLGTLSGTGSLQIAAGATLDLNGACAAGQSIAFTGPLATLAVNEESYAPAGTLTGFAAGDALDIRGSQISAATFTPSGAGGTLALYYGIQVAATLTLAGTYANTVFLTAGDGAGGTLITLATGSAGGGGPSPGTSTPDQYTWIAAGSGAWTVAANWTDVTRNQTPAAIAPGVHDFITIAAQQIAFTVIAGPANAAALALTGDVALSGAYNIATLSIGEAAGTGFTDATLDLLPATTIAATTANIAAGAISASGSATALTVAGTLTLGGGPPGIGLPTATLTASSGASVQAAALTMGGGSGATLTTDPTASIEIGTAGGAALGAVTIDSGATLAGNGQVNPFGQIIDNGSIFATGGTLTLGSITGTGRLTVDTGAILELLAPTADAITLDGTAATAASGLAFADARDAPTGTITGLVPGNFIHLEGSPLTSVQFAPNATGGTLTLAYDGTIVVRLHLAGSFTNIRFILNPDGAGGSIIALATSTAGGGGGGQTGTDQLAWTQPISGAWGHAANWTDLTRATTATLPPGAQTPVTLAGPTGTTFQDLSGGGTCASLSASGNTLLNGTYTTGQLSLAAGATLSISFNSQINAAQVLITSATLLASGANSSIAVANTLTAAGALAAAQAGGSIQCGSLALTGGNATADVHAYFEIGSLGGTQQGALTIDAGAQASGSGSLNLAGQTIDNGTILAQGGTLFLGATSGAGSLAVGTEATLALTAPDTCPVTFTGGGATLLLDSAQFPAGIALSGFAPGDAIATANTPIDTVAYQPISATLGTLTLSEAGQQVGQLVLAGSYAGDTFAVQPNGQGAQVTVAPSSITAPPPGTVTPDTYTWVGRHGSGWSNAANWTDTTQGQNPALLAPGLNDSDSIAGGAGQALTIAGPADAAALSLSGTVSLTGTYAIGALTVAPIGVLAIGAGNSVAAATAIIAGGTALNGGTLAVAGTLTLGGAGGPAAALAATSGAIADAGAALLYAGSTLLTDATSAIEIGGTTGAVAGSITIDAGGILAGAGTISTAGPITDEGTITASGGTLLLGAVSGTGSLLVGVGATLALQSTAGAGLTADFAAAGTLSLSQATLAAGTTPAIADFGVGDQINLALGGATAAIYAQTAPDQGVLTIEAASGPIAQLTLLGSQAGLDFTVAGTPSGGTILTALSAQNAGTGGGFVSNPISASETITLADLVASLEAAFPYAITPLASALVTTSNNPVVYVGFSPDGQQIGPPTELYPNIEMVGEGATPDSSVVLPTGYNAVILEGTEPLYLSDNTAGHELLVGNLGNDSIFATGDGDTLVGATGASTEFVAAVAAGVQATLTGHDVTVVGGGDDFIYTNNDSALISTAIGHHTRIIAGSPQNEQAANDITLNGADTVICSNIGFNSSNDNVTVQASATVGGELIFGQARGLLNFVGGNAPATIVGSGGELLLQGGAADGGIVFAGSSGLDYTAGAGSAIIVAGSGQTQINAGGPGAVIVFGGSGEGEYAGAPGSIFVIGGGPSTVQAAAGVGIYIYGGADVSVAGGVGADAYAGTSTGNNIFQAGAGPETMWGGLGNDLFLAGAGNDAFFSGGGRDVFSFTSGLAGGSDIILGFTPGQDTLKLDGYGLTAPAITYAYGDSILNLQDGTQIVVFGVSDLTASSIVLG